MQWAIIGRLWCRLGLVRRWTRCSNSVHFLKGWISPSGANGPALPGSSMQSWYGSSRSLMQSCWRVKAWSGRQYTTWVTTYLSKRFPMRPIRLLGAGLIRFRLHSLYDHFLVLSRTSFVGFSLRVYCWLVSLFVLFCYYSVKYVIPLRLSLNALTSFVSNVVTFMVCGEPKALVSHVSLLYRLLASFSPLL